MATYNIGAKTGQMFAGPSRAKFEEKLPADVQFISQHADVIGAQEVAPFWYELMSKILVTWSSGSMIIDGLVTFVSPSWTVCMRPKDLHRFLGKPECSASGAGGFRLEYKL